MFRSREDVEEWLKPLDYDEFWDAIRPYALDLPARTRCDDDIDNGASEDTVLRVLKRMAELTIIKDQKLPPRSIEKWRWAH